MSLEPECPVCGKSVAAQTALIAHLEFAHQIDDPIAYLEDLEGGGKKKGRRARKAKSDAKKRKEALEKASKAKLAAARGRADDDLMVDLPPLAADVKAEPRRYQAPGSEAAQASAFVKAEDDVRQLREKASKRMRERQREPFFNGEPGKVMRFVRPAAMVVVVLIGLVAAFQLLTDDDGDGTVEVATSTTTTRRAAATTTTLPPAPSDFRLPFALDGAVVSCTPQGGQDAYELSVTFSGGRNITFEGVTYEGRDGDGERTFQRVEPDGTSRYLDTLVVLDGNGTAYDVDVNPPIFLGGC